MTVRTQADPGPAWYFARCSNVGRWGADDEQGTLNLITPARRVEAGRLVEVGRTVPLGHDLTTAHTPIKPAPASHRMLDNAHAPWMCHDSIDIAPHGYSVTHLDAPGHVFYEGLAWNARRSADALAPDGLVFGSISALRTGIFTRGVLLDVAAARGVEWLMDDDDVTARDLDAAEARTGVRVGPGDAIVVRIGLKAREAQLGPEDPRRRAGLAPDCLVWMRDRDVAVYAGDCIERRPSPWPAHPLPVHMIGMAAMGLVFLDNVATEGLRDACEALHRWTFLLTCAPVVLAGATGSAVNPLAVF